MIERRIDHDKERNISEHRRQTNLKNGILFIFIGLGLLIAQLLVKQFEVPDEFITYVTMFLIFGGGRIGQELTLNESFNFAHRSPLTINCFSQKYPK